MTISKSYTFFMVAFSFLAMQCNNENKKGALNSGKEKVQTESSFRSIDTLPTATAIPPSMEGDTVKVYRDYITGHLDSLTRLIERYPDNGEYYLRRGELRITQGDNAGGCDDYKKAKSLGIKNMQSLIEKNCK